MENGEDSDEDADGWANVDEDEDGNDDDKGFEDLGEVELQDKDSEEERQVQVDHGPDCKCMKPARDHPDWIWVFTEEGLKLFGQWQMEAEKRDQDAFGVYLYNDFTAYGLTEVMENQVGVAMKAIPLLALADTRPVRQLLAFNKEMNRKPPSPFALWSLLESIGMFLTYDIDQWFGKYGSLRPFPSPRSLVADPTSSSLGRRRRLGRHGRDDHDIRHRRPHHPRRTAHAQTSRSPHHRLPRPDPEHRPRPLLLHQFRARMGRHRRRRPRHRRDVLAAPSAANGGRGQDRDQGTVWDGGKSR